MKKEIMLQLVVGIVSAVFLCLVGNLPIRLGGEPGWSVSLTTLIVYIASFVGGTWGAVIGSGLYLVLGAFVLPEAAGLAFFQESTSFFVVGLILMAFICSEYVRNSASNIVKVCVAFIVATVCYYLVGCGWYIWVEKSYVDVAVSQFVIPNLIADAIKIILGIAIGWPVRKLLVKSGFLMQFSKVAPNLGKEDLVDGENTAETVVNDVTIDSVASAENEE